MIISYGTDYGFTVKQSKKPLFCQFHVDVSLQEHQVPQVPYSDTTLYTVALHGDILHTTLIVTYTVTHTIVSY